MRSRIELMISGMELGCVLKAGENLDVIQEKIDDLKDRTMGMRQNLIQQRTNT